MENQRGFTLIELMMVITLIGILAAIAVPKFSVYRERAYLSEAMSLVRPVIEDIADYHGHRGIFPATNKEAGVAEAGVLKGKYVESIRIADGQITIRFNDSAGDKSGGTIALTPTANEESAPGIIQWERKDSF